MEIKDARSAQEFIQDWTRGASPTRAKWHIVEAMKSARVCWNLTPDHAMNTKAAYLEAFEVLKAWVLKNS